MNVPDRETMAYADSGIGVRAARRDDLPAIIALLADDDLGRGREDPSLPLDPRYGAAFAQVSGDPAHLLLVVEEAGRIVGYLQVTFIPGLTRRGALRGHIEAVRIAADRRGHGLGRRLLDTAIAECRKRGCVVVQLTSDRSRGDAHRFYEQLGFRATHLGMKLNL